jgi:hypothetical protein
MTYVDLKFFTQNQSMNTNVKLRRLPWDTMYTELKILTFKKQEVLVGIKCKTKTLT